MKFHVRRASLFSENTPVKPQQSILRSSSFRSSINQKKKVHFSNMDSVYFQTFSQNIKVSQSSPTSPRMNKGRNSTKFYQKQKKTRIEKKRVQKVSNEKRSNSVSRGIFNTQRKIQYQFRDRSFYQKLNQFYRGKANQGRLVSPPPKRGISDPSDWNGRIFKLKRREKRVMRVKVNMENQSIR